jgi:hypothetical protein
MNTLADFFKGADTTLGVFYPTHYLVAVLPSPEAANRCVDKLHAAGFTESDAIAADGKAVLELAGAEKRLGGLLLQALSRFFSTEQKFTDHDLQHAHEGAGFLAVRCATGELKDAAWAIVRADDPLDARYYAVSGIEHLAGDLDTD